MRFPVVDQAAKDYAMCRIDLDEAIRAVRPWFRDYTDREIDAKLRMTASVLLLSTLEKLDDAFGPDVDLHPALDGGGFA